MKFNNVKGYICNSHIGTSDADGDSWARNLGKHIAFQAGEPDDLAVIAGNLIFDCTFRVLERSFRIISGTTEIINVLWVNLTALPDIPIA